MSDSVYIASPRSSREQRILGGGAKSAVEMAARTRCELRIAEVVRQAVLIEDGKVTGYRVRLNSFSHATVV
jgi:flavin-binding protein dodecin